MHIVPLGRASRGTLFAISIIAFSLLSGVFFAPSAHAADTGTPAPIVRSIDAMKYTKDVMTHQPTDAEIGSLVEAYKAMNANYVALSIPMDATSAYPAGNAPSPRTAEQFTQVWANAVHSAGLHIIWRGTFSGIEGLYGFPKLLGTNRIQAGTASTASGDGSATWLGKAYQYIAAHPSYMADGDIWAPLPERTEGIFSDGTAFLPNTGTGIQAAYSKFFSDLKIVSEAAFLKIGKKVTTGLSANNTSEIISGWIPGSLFADAGTVSVDYYGSTHTPAEMDHDIRAMAAAKGKPVFFQEWGDYWNEGLNSGSRAAYLSSVYAVIKKLASDGIITGFNYWGGWDNAAEGVLTKDAGGFHINERGKMLAGTFAVLAGNSPIVPPVLNPIDPIDPIIPVPSQSTCPPASDNAFTGCYYPGQNLSSASAMPLFVRTDTKIDFTWNDGSPDPAVPRDQFSVRWQGHFSFEGGTYAFTVAADDGVRLYVDGSRIMDEWHGQSAYQPHTVTKSLSVGKHLVVLEYYEDYGGAVAKLSWEKKAALPAANSFAGEYYRGTDLSQSILKRTDPKIDFAWNDASPDPAVPADQFSVRWTGDFDFTEGDHAFTLNVDDGARLYIDNERVIDAWYGQSAYAGHAVTKHLSAGIHSIKLEYYEDYGGAVAKLKWN